MMMEEKKRWDIFEILKNQKDKKHREEEEHTQSGDLIVIIKIKK